MTSGVETSASPLLLEKSPKAETLWRSILQRLLQRPEKEDCENWLSEVEPLAFNGVRLRLRAPNPTYRDWLSETYTPLIREEAEALGFAGLEVEFLDAGDEDAPALPFDDAPQPRVYGLNPNGTFDSFVEGEANRFARAAALAVAENPGASYNPLFLYGGVGLGKTHLLHAIGNAVAGRNSRASVCYVTAETFTNELIEAIRRQRTKELRDKYRAMDLLLIDDIQFLAGKDQTQEEFFHTFNHLHEAGRQIVITSDTPPGELRNVKERLVSRFAWGLTADLKMPDLETRVAILRKKAEVRHIELADDVAMLIAARARHNVRELESMLNYVTARAQMENVPLSASFTNDILQGHFGEGEKIPTVREVQRAVAEHFHISHKRLLDKSHAHDVTLPRHVAMYLCREMTHKSFPVIAQDFGFDHASVMYACRKVARRMKVDENFRKEIQMLALTVQA
jgi:chromosomal replication initiator protein